MTVYFNFYFLPLLVPAYLLYWFVCRSESQRTVFIALSSAMILALLHPIYSLIVLCMVGAVYSLLKLKQLGRIEGKLILLFTAGIALTIMLAGKYAPAIGKALFPPDDPFLAYCIVPLGVSYFFFRIVQYALDQHRGLIKEVSFLHLYAFLTFLPVLPAGPVETYQGFYAKRAHTRDGRMHLEGVRRLLLGFFKKLVLVDVLLPHLHRTYWSSLLTRELAGSLDDIGGATMYAFYTYARVYFDLAACADIAIGCSLLFGFRIMEDLNKPFLSANLSDFWQRWHISVSSWCRNNIFFPVFGATRKVWLGLICSMLCMGLWHNLNLNWLSFALLHGSILSAIYFLGVYKLRSPGFKALSKTRAYLFASWLFTQLFVASVDLISMPIPFERARQLFLYAIPGMACLFAAGLLAFFACAAAKSLTGKCSCVSKAKEACIFHLTPLYNAVAYEARNTKYTVLILAVATGALFFAGLERAITSGLYIKIPEKYLNTSPFDPTLKFAYALSNIRRSAAEELGTPIYFIGGSSVLTDIFPTDIEKELSHRLQRRIRASQHGIPKGSFMFIRDIIDYFPETAPGIVVLGLAIAQFSYSPEEAYPYTTFPVFIAQHQKNIGFKEKILYSLPFRAVSIHIKKYLQHNLKELVRFRLPVNEVDLYPEQYNYMAMENREKLFIGNLERLRKGYASYNAIQSAELASLLALIQKKGHYPVVMLLPMAHDFINGRFAGCEGFVQKSIEICAAMGIPVLDYYSVPSLTMDKFYDAIHLNNEGRALFTSMIADRLTPIVERYLLARQNR